MGQLRLWLAFARRKAKARTMGSASSTTAGIESPATLANRQNDDAANVRDSDAHIDKRV
jgi:hypothetical protein